MNMNVSDWLLKLLLVLVGMFYSCTGMRGNFKMLDSILLKL